MRKSITCLFCFIIFFGFAQQRELRLAADVWPPFTNTEGEKSILSDLVQQALTRIEIESTMEITSFTEVLEKLHTGTFDGSPGLWISDERLKKYYFSKDRKSVV